MKIGVIHVVLWTFGVFLALGIALLLAAGISARVESDPVVAAAIQSAVYLAACALFAARRPGRSWSETFALRGTSVWLMLGALALGIASCIPAEALAGVMERLVPMSQAERAARELWFTPRSLSQGVALFVFAAGVGVFAEELLFRGALYTGLRPHHTPASAGWTTGVLFTLSHWDPRIWPSILALSGLLALLRAVSGSLWPSLFLHAGFNATALGMPFSSPALKDPSIAVVVASTVTAALLIGAVAWIGRRSSAADRARQLDLEPDPGLGATHP